jgi:hypothetical protein
MSSSRSIAAARARRANETTPINTSRPGTSIGSASSFSQAPIGSRGNVRITQSQQQHHQQQQQHHQQQEQQQTSKITLSNAIALITLRLGRIETLIQENQEGGITIATPSNNSEINTETLEIIMNRIVLLENNLTSITNNRDINKLSKENIELKDNFQNMVLVFNSFMKDTNEKFTDYETAIVELESKIKLQDEEPTIEYNSIQTQTQTQLELNTVIENFTIDTDQNILSEDLKNLIRNETTGI